jgi:uncharacterized membrane protein YeaQ/YmgE (transglycosylase-associated protein family)
MSAGNISALKRSMFAFHASTPITVSHEDRSIVFRLMRILWMLVVGLIVGAIARFLMPGAEHMGWPMTAIVGVAGSFIGGFISSLIWKPIWQRALHPAGFVMSVVGALILLFIMRHVR